jgi:hypothetical protein
MGKVCAGCFLVGAITRLLKRFDGKIVNQGRSLLSQILQEEVVHTLEKYAWMELLIIVIGSATHATLPIMRSTPTRNDLWQENGGRDWK